MFDRWANSRPASSRPASIATVRGCCSATPDCCRHSTCGSCRSGPTRRPRRSWTAPSTRARLLSRPMADGLPSSRTRRDLSRSGSSRTRPPTSANPCPRAAAPNRAGGRTGKSCSSSATSRTLMAAPFTNGVAGVPVPLFRTRVPVTGNPYRMPYAVAADGQRFLVNTAPEDAPPPAIHVVLDWRALLPAERRWLVETDRPCANRVAARVVAGAPSQSLPPASSSPGKPGPDDLLPRVGAYVDAWERELGSVVADEAYQQSVVPRAPVGSQVPACRTLRRARLAPPGVGVPVLIHFDDGVSHWLGFRSVVRVDGKAVSKPAGRRSPN